MSQGVCSHSTPAAQDRFVIFSTKNPMTVKHELNLHSIGHKTLTGMWKGTSERSFLVKADDFRHVLAAVPGTLYMEQSILYLEPCNARGKRHAWLVDTNTLNEEYIGLFQETQLGPRDGQDYTFDPTTSTYYVCVIEDKKAIREVTLPEALQDALAGNLYGA